MYSKYARLIVNYSLGLKKGDKLLIVSTYLAEPLVQEVVKEALLAGAHPEVLVSFNGIGKILYDYASDEQLRHVSPMYGYAVDHYDAFLTIRAPFNLKELEHVDPEKKKITAFAQTAVKQRFMRRASRGTLRWTLCEYPTDAQAQESGLSRKEFEAFVFSACYLDTNDPVAKWNGMRDAQQRVVDRLNGCGRIRFLGEHIDLSFSTRGRIWINSDDRHNMPSGEVFTGPVETSVNGKVRFSYPGIFMGQAVDYVTLEVRRGEVVSWDARQGKELLDRILEIPGAKRFGEAAIGTNKAIKTFTKNILFDEKMGGTIHMALGASYPETGGRNKSPVHWDLLADMRHGEIYADGVLVYRQGDFVI